MRRRRVPMAIGGEEGIRTLGALSGTHDFQSCLFVHSSTSPRHLALLADSRAAPCINVQLSHLRNPYLFRAASYRLIYSSTGVDAIVSAIKSIGRSSTRLNRTHDLPIFSLFPLALNRSSNHVLSSS